MAEIEHYPAGELELNIVRPIRMPGGNWIEVPDKAMVNPDLSPTTRLYFFMLIRVVQLGQIVDDEKVASWMGVNERALVKHRKELIDAGYLDYKRGRDPEYILNVDGTAKR